ncbi:hypothetical protein D3C74_362680 [compost metagenome]
MPASIDAIISPAAALVCRIPDWTTIHPNSMDPSRFPPKQNSSVPTAERTGIVRVTAPWVRIIMAEVLSSAPAKTTRVSATENTPPATSRSAGAPAARNGPAVATMRTTPTPM